MKKLIKTVCLTLTFILAISFAGCGPAVQIDPSNSGKTKINLSLYGGGHGTEYMDVFIDKFMELHPEYDEEYYIDYDEEKLHSGLIRAELEAGYGDTQMYVMAQNDFVDFIYTGYLADISDVKDMKPDGEGGKTIEQKMLRYPEWQSIYSKYGEGLYALPYADSVLGWVYDHQTFVDNGWYNFATVSDSQELTAQGITFVEHETNGRLIFQSSSATTNYNQGDYILAKGKDGKFGTYDDGQPVNEEQFDAMITKITASGTKAFISSGQIGSYSNHIISGLVGQIGGIDAYNTYFTYDSKGQPITLVDGTSEVITLENGYKVYEMEAVYKAYEWLSKYFDSRKESSLVSLHPAVSDGTKNHIDTQNLYLLGYQASQTNPRSAILTEGAWWEYEARSMFKTLGEIDATRGYGKRDYRYLLYPDIEGQVSEKSVLSACESGAIIVPKDNNADRLKVTKEFLAFFYSDWALNEFLTMTNSVMPVEYNMTDADRNKLTKFTRNVLEMYADTQNVEIVRPQVACLLSPLQYAGGRSIKYFATYIDSIESLDAYKQIREKSLTQIKNNLGAYTQSEWNSFIATAKEQGFYQDAN